MALKLVSAQVRLAGLKLRRGDNDRLVRLFERVPQQPQTGHLLKMLDNIPQENQVIMREPVQQGACVADVEAIVQIAMHRCEVCSVAFDAIDAYSPILSLVTGRVVLGFVNVGVFPKEMAPLAKADTDV